MGAGCLHMRGQLLDTMMKLSYLKIFGIWTIAALFTSTQLYLKSLQAGGDDSWAKLFFVQFIVWNIWACFTPFIFFLGRRFRIDRQSYYRGVAVHTFFAVLMVLLYLAGRWCEWRGFIGSVQIPKKSGIHFQSDINTMQERDIGRRLAMVTLGDIILLGRCATR